MLAGTLLLVAVLVAGWLGWRELWAHGGDRELAWRDLTSRTLATPGRSQLRAFDDEASLRAELGPSATTPPIDFARREAVLLASGPRSSSAFALQIVRITDERRRIVISMRERAPTLARPGAPTLSFPFRLITLERSGKPIELDWEGRP